MPLIERPFHGNAAQQIGRRWYFDPDTGEATIATQQNVQPLIDVNAAKRHSGSDWGPTKWKGEWHHAASIPTTLYFELQEKFGDDAKAWTRWLNDRDNQVFRSKAGQL
jgi:hypothetical protein